MIPQDFIDDLIARTDIVDLIDQYVPLKKKWCELYGVLPISQRKIAQFFG